MPDRTDSSLAAKPTAGSSTAAAGPSKVVRVGLALFALGVIAVLVDVIPFFVGVHNRPLWLNLACLLVPIGLVVAVWAGLARGRADQKRALRRAEELADHG